MRKTWEKRNFTVRDIVVKELSLMRKLLELFFIIWRQGQEIKERLWLALSFFFFIFLTCKFVDVREQEPLSVTTALVLRSFPFSIIITKPRGSEFQLLQVALKPLRQTSIRGIECRVAAQGKEWEGADVMVFPNHV